MTVTFSVDDTTIQVARVQGLLGFVLDLPPVKALLEEDARRDDQSDALNLLSSGVGDDVRACLVEAALNYTEATHSTGRQEQVDLPKESLHETYNEQQGGGDEQAQKHVGSGEGRADEQDQG